MKSKRGGEEREETQEEGVGRQERKRCEEKEKGNASEGEEGTPFKTANMFKGAVHFINRVNGERKLMATS